MLDRKCLHVIRCIQIYKVVIIFIDKLGLFE